MHLQNRHRYFGEKYEARLTTLCQVIIPMFGTKLNFLQAKQLDPISLEQKMLSCMKNCLNWP